MFCLKLKLSLDQTQVLLRPSNPNLDLGLDFLPSGHGLEPLP